MPNSFIKVSSLFLILLLVASASVLNGRKILEIQTRTSTDTDAGLHVQNYDCKSVLLLGMDGGLTVEICDAELTCCNAGMLDSFGYVLSFKNIFTLKCWLVNIFRNDFQNGMSMFSMALLLDSVIILILEKALPLWSSRTMVSMLGSETGSGY